jgi:alpha-1,6-mannosyltransferase
LAQEKNTQTLFAAFAELVRRAPDRFHLLVVGDGAQRNELRKLRDQTGQLTWQPYSADPLELARLYRAADLFVHPGVQETFGLTALESQACGTPVVGIRGSYMDRIIFGNQEHWARENSVAALVEAIAAAAHGELRESGLAAARSVRQRYSWSVVFDRIFEVYTAVREAYHAG